MGRSRGGLTTKLHLLAEGRGRALAKRITPGQGADTRELVALVDAVAVPRPGGVGRHRKKLDHLTADKAYGSRANRRWLRALPADAACSGWVDSLLRAGGHENSVPVVTWSSGNA